MTKLRRIILAALLLLSAFSATGEARDIEALLQTMPLEQKIGQMLLPALPGAGGGTVKMTPQTAEFLRRYHVGGIILFRENLVDAEQTRQLISELQAAAPLPLFIAVDQEGGRVSRLPDGTIMPGNMALGAGGDPELAFLAAKAIGEELAELGFNLNLAPVLDINSNPDNPVIGIRSFGEDPRLVADLGKAFLRGLHTAGIAAAVKHFPGHGDVSQDSHHTLPFLPYRLTELTKRELLPFREALREQPDMVMTAHIALPALETQVQAGGSGAPVPATLSAAVLNGVLRREMGYDGVIITDALNMKAVAAHFSPAEIAVKAVAAGADILLMPQPAQAHAALTAAVRQGILSEQRIDQSLRRILAVKAKRGLLRNGELFPTLHPDAKKQRDALAAHLAGRAVTLLRNQRGILPFSLRPDRRLLLLAPAPEQAELLRREAAALYRVHGLDDSLITAWHYRQGGVEAAVETADLIVLATESANATDRDPAKSPAAAAAVRLSVLAKQLGKPVAVMMLRNPYDAAYLPSAPALLAVYAPLSPNMAAGLRVIFGLAQPQGRLPVTIPGPGGVLYPAGFGLGFNGGFREKLHKPVT
ncbi:MAG: beta-N-acetylhexosaminidase [Sporomusaceae bacterium]|nr:beta-N-acetylhexosaminidase [Sporomusaceae bacterium]